MNATKRGTARPAALMTGRSIGGHFLLAVAVVLAGCGRQNRLHASGTRPAPVEDAAAGGGAGNDGGADASGGTAGEGSTTVQAGGGAPGGGTGGAATGAVAGASSGGSAGTSTSTGGVTASGGVTSSGGSAGASSATPGGGSTASQVGGAVSSGGTGGATTGAVGGDSLGGSASASSSTGGVSASGGSPPADAPPAEVWKVTIDVFSGMPNPVFTLEPSEVAEVRARLGSAPLVRPMASANETVRPARLGYRGMLVKATAGTNAIEDTEISEGKILRKTAGALYDGSSAGIEGYLLSLAVSKGAIDQGLADQIKSQSHGTIP